MKIAVAANGSALDATIPAHFADADWLLIVEMDRRQICASARARAEDPENAAFARFIVQWDCESVICGALEKAPFEILAGRGVTRSLGAGLTAADALNREQTLPLITDYIGGTGC